MSDDFWIQPQIRKVYTTGQISKMFGVSSRTCTKWIDSGLLKGYKIPGSRDRRVTYENLCRFLEENPEIGVLVKDRLKLFAELKSVIIYTSPNSDLPRLSSSSHIFEYIYDYFILRSRAMRAGLVATSHVIIDFATDRDTCKKLPSFIRPNLSKASFIAYVYEDEQEEHKLKQEGYDIILRRPFSAEYMRLLDI